MADQITDQCKPTSTAFTSNHEEAQATSMRKRHATDPHVLVAKITKEADKIIKQKVAQNLVNWEFREQVKELESIRDRQQQNLVELQMQYETLDGDYQQELRNREDIANRVNSTRSICNVLEEHFSRLSEILSRCQADRQTLYDIYQKVSPIIKDVRVKMATNEIHFQTTVDNLKQQLATETERKTDMAKTLADNKTQWEQSISRLEKSAASSQANCDALQNEIKQRKADVDDKDELIKTLRLELSTLQQKYKFETSEMKSMLFAQEKEIAEKSEALSTLSRALANQELFSHNLAEENSQLQEKAAKAEEDGTQLLQAIQKLNTANEDLKKELEHVQIEANKLVDNQNELSKMYNEQLQGNMELKEVKQQLLQTNCDLVATVQDMEKTLQQLIEEKNKFVDNQNKLSESYNEQLQGNLELRQTICDQTTTIQDMEKTVQKIMEEKRLTTVEHENEVSEIKEEMREEIEKKNKEVSEMKKEIEKKSKEVYEMKEEIENKNKELFEVKEEMRKEIEKNSKEVADIKEEMREEINKKSKDVQAKCNIITELMSQVKLGTDARARLEVMLDQHSRDLNKAKVTEEELLRAKMIIEEDVLAKQSEIKRQEIKMADLKAEIILMQKVIVETSQERDAAKKSAALLKSPSPHGSKPDISRNQRSDPDSPLFSRPESQGRTATPVKEQSWVKPSGPKAPRRTSKGTFVTPEPHRVPPTVRQTFSPDRQAPSQSFPAPQLARQAPPASRQAHSDPPRFSQEINKDFDFLSDSSVEGYVMDPRETDRRYDAMLAGKSIASPLRVVPVKKQESSNMDQIPVKGPRFLSRNIRNKGVLTNKRRFTPMSERGAKHYKGD